MKKGFKVGPYEIGGELGRGATGTVYEGIDHLNELTVAIKVIKHSQTSKRLLLHEIDVSQRLQLDCILNRPCIVRIVVWLKLRNHLYKREMLRSVCR